MIGNMLCAGNNGGRVSRLAVRIIAGVVAVVGCVAGVYSVGALGVYSSALEVQSDSAGHFTDLGGVLLGGQNGQSANGGQDAGGQGEALRGAPGLPFRGVIGYYGDGYFSAPTDPYPYPGRGLLYWNAVDSSLAYVPLGDDFVICGPGHMVVHPDGVEVLTVEDFFYGGIVMFRVPWGDDAYPSFLYSPEGVAWSGVSVMQVNEDFRVEKVDEGMFKIFTPLQERFYSVGTGGLYYEGEEYTIPENRLPQWESGAPSSDMSGSDGRYYGFNSVPYETSCTPQMGFVISGVTGELVACGWSYFGPVLANVDGSFTGIEDPVFPVDDPESEPEDCYQDNRVLDIRDLAENAISGSDSGDDL